MEQNSSQAVFIADDDEDDRYLLRLAFEQHSPECRLIFAEDGMALLNILAQLTVTPCLIILDLNMPRLNGLESLSVLRSNPLYQHTPIVILTTSSAMADRQQAYELGADEFMTKPLRLELLGNAVRQFRKNWHLDACI